MRILSLCSGFGGLELGLQAVYGGELVAYAEFDKHASKVMAHHYPNVPNLGDITKADWNGVGHIDWVTAGYPCQGFSLAGKRKGEDDPRYIWPGVAECIRVVRPGYVLLENVASHLTLGFDTVLGSLSSMGYNLRWGLVRASDAGAPHRRERLFVVARHSSVCGWYDPPAAGSERGEERQRAQPAGGSDHAAAHAQGQRRAARGTQHGAVEGPGRSGTAVIRDPQPSSFTDTGGAGFQGALTEPEAGWLPEPGRGDHAAADAGGHGPQGGEAATGSNAQRTATDPGGRRPGRCGEAAADTDGAGRGLLGGFDAVGCDADRRSGADTTRDGAESATCEAIGPGVWGQYWPAVRRWEQLTGRRAPWPREPSKTGGEHLSATFVEWMQGLPLGHVTAVPGLAWSHQIKILGNGVVPQQAELALRLLMGEIR